MHKIKDNSSDAHFHWSPVIDQSKSKKIKIQKGQLFQPPSGPWSNQNTVPLLWQHCGQTCYCFPTKFKPQVSAKHRWVDKCIRTAGEPCFGWSKRPYYSAWSKHIMLCRLNSWTKSNFMIRNHSTAAVPWLIISDVNFNFSWAGLI